MAVVTAERSLVDTQHAFDRVAATYHQSNAENPILCAMRARTIAALRAAVPPRSRILDLGCGPGTDDVPLAAGGYEVTAIDWSPAMVDAAHRAARAAGVEHRMLARHLGIHELDQLAPATFDAALSNFGALNCVPNLAGAARALAARLQPRGIVVASVIGRVCPWEVALYVVRGRWRRAAIRFARRPMPVPLDGRTVWTRYYTPGQFARVFRAAGFSVVSVRALGLAAPPPYLSGFADRHPALVERLHLIDDRIGSWPGLRSAGDHFLMVLRRT